MPISVPRSFNIKGRVHGASAFVLNTWNSSSRQVSSRLLQFILFLLHKHAWLAIFLYRHQRVPEYEVALRVSFFFG